MAHGETCKDCGGFTDKIIQMKRGSISVCPECAKKEEYSKYKARQTINYMPMSAMKLLSPRAGLCQECAVAHLPETPHDKSSLYYQTNFYMKNERYPTWEDAMAHCTDEMKADWRGAMGRTHEATEGLGTKFPEGFWD